PLPAAAAAVLFVTALLLAKSRYQVAWSFGLGLYFAAVILGGGDFMRGRLLLPLLVGSSCLGILSLATAAGADAPTASHRQARPKQRTLALAALAILAVVLAIARVIGSPQNDAVSAAGIVDERMWYAGYHLAAYRANGRLTDAREDPAIAEELRRFASRC